MTTRRKFHAFCSTSLLDSTDAATFVHMQYSGLQRVQQAGGLNKGFAARCIAEFELKNARGTPIAPRSFLAIFERVAAAKSEAAEARRGRSAAKNGWQAAVPQPARPPTPAQPALQPTTDLLASGSASHSGAAPVVPDAVADHQQAVDTFLVEWLRGLPQMPQLSDSARH